MKSLLFVNGIEIQKLKAKSSETNTALLCLGNFSKGFLVDYMNKTVLDGYVYDFSIDYDIIKVDNIVGSHKYLSVHTHKYMNEAIV